MRTAAYCRYSSDAQRDASIRDQLRNIEGYCARIGWPTPALYQDQAISGSRSDRPGYRALLDAAERRTFDVILVDDLSRLSRDHIESAQAIRRLKYAGVRVIGVSDGTDTARDNYKLDTGLRGLMSELYLDDLAKKTHRGLMGQALDGYSAGGLPYGYKSQHDGFGFRRAVNEDQAPWVRYVYERYALGVSCRQIADELNRRGVASPRGSTWSHSALYPDSKGVGMLGNPIYVGRPVWNKTEWTKDPDTGKRRRILRPRSEWIITEAPELAIISEDLWQACQDRAREQKRDTADKSMRGQGAGGRGPKYLFSGLLRCGVCGAAYTIQGRLDYGCSAHKNRGASVCSNGLKIRRTTIESILIEAIKGKLLSDDAFRDFEREARAWLATERIDPADARKALRDATTERDNIMRAIAAGIITPTTKAALNNAEERVAAAEENLRHVESFQPSQLLPRAREMYRDMLSTLQHVDDMAAAREVLRVLIGDVRLIPEGGKLTAEMQSAGLAGALQISLVAGAGFERYSNLEPASIRFAGLR